MLSRADLEAIRSVVREEIKRALGQQSEPPAIDEDDAIDPESSLSHDHQRALVAFARASADMYSGRRGADAIARKAEARYRAGYDESYQARARKLLGKPDGVLVSADEMEGAITTWDAQNKERSRKRAQTIADKRAATTVTVPRARGRGSQAV